MKPFEPQYWVVWHQGGGAPTMLHRSYEAAKSEAIRLARNNAGKRFVVLAAAAAFEKVDVQEVRFEDVSGAYDDDSNTPF